MQDAVERLRARFRQGRGELFPPHARTDACLGLLRRYTDLVDEVVREIHDYACRCADREASRTHRSGLAIGATGGYGRGELSPFSDIDIAFIPSEQEDPWVEAAVHTAFRLVMDVFLSFREVRVGYSYRPVQEVPTWDLVTKTALLDLRHLCGDEGLSDMMRVRLREVFPVLDLLLELETQSKRESGPMATSLYSVEPNLKEGPGSLRDLHRGRWILQLLTGSHGEDLYHQLLRQNLLTEEQVAQARMAAEWFWAARNWLHLTAGRKSDTLINNYQDRIARELGSGSAQQWLAEHYRHSETLVAFREAAVRAVLRGPVQMSNIVLENGFLQRRGERAGPNDAGVVSLLQMSQRYGIPVGIDEIRQLSSQKVAALCVESCTAEESWAFLGILREGRGVAATIRSMVRLGLLDRFVNGFSRLMRHVPPDPAHRYTVGDHSIRIIEHLESLREGRDAGGQRFAELLAECAHFDMLCLAALLHDIGKLDIGSDHCETGVGQARLSASRLELPPEKQEILEILVRHHTLLVRTARLQDLKSPTVIQKIVEQCRSLEVLRHLYVFSYVDTCAVAERNWTSMDYRDLEELYRKVQQNLSGEEQGQAAMREDRMGQIRRRLATADSPLDEEAICAHCDAMPAGYVLNTPLEEIAFHVQLLQRLDAEKAIVDVYNRPGEDFSELTVCAYDDPQPGLLAKITGALYGCDVDIHRARVYTMERDRPVVLDTMWVRSGASPVSESKAKKIRRALHDILTGRMTLDTFLEKAGKRVPDAIPIAGIELRNDLSEEHTVVHIIAHDLQGLLHLMTRAISRCGLDIHTAKVATWNARAENNFYVTTSMGLRIPDQELGLWRDRLICALAKPVC